MEPPATRPVNRDFAIHGPRNLAHWRPAERPGPGPLRRESSRLAELSQQLPRACASLVQPERKLYGGRT